MDKLSAPSTLRILIVDDHEVVRRGIRSILSTTDGVEICGEATDGSDAIEKAFTLKPDVITMDISMPKLNGVDATREIRRLLPDVAVLIMTQHDAPEMMKLAADAGATAYITKTAISTELIPALNRLRGNEIAPGPVFDGSHANLSPPELPQQLTAAFDNVPRDLEEAFTNLELVSSHASVAVTRCSRDLRYLWSNAYYANWLQIPLSNIVGRPITDVLGTEAFEALLPYFERALKGETVSYEREITFNRIGKRWISATYTPTLDYDGIPSGWVAVISDLTEHHRMECALQESEARAEMEAKALINLHDLSSELWAVNNLQDGLKQILRAAIQLLGGDKGNVQLLDTERGMLTIVAQQGFDEAFLNFFHEVSSNDNSACGRALRMRQKEIIPDVEADEAFAPYRDVARAAGFRAVTSIPLIANDGTIFGILSTHFRVPHIPSEQSLRRLELYARQAADFIARCRAQTELERKVAQRTHALQEANRQLQKISGRLMQVQDEERRRLARELHDSVGQLLAYVGMNLASISEEKGKLSPAAARCLRESSSIMQKITDEIRTLSYLLHPPLLDEVGLKSALEEYVKGFQQRSKLTITLDLPDKYDRLSRDSEISLFRVVQESLTNIHRHSKSASACVRMRSTLEEVTLEISDKGSGVNGDLSKVSGVGIRGMQERMRLLGGSLKIHSGDQGTTVQVTLPKGQNKSSELSF